MKVLVAYDVATPDKKGQRRLRRVARVCQDFGQRVQKSLFECTVGAKEWVELRQRLLDEYDSTQDSLRFYFLDDNFRIEHPGAHVPLDFDEGLIVQMDLPRTTSA
jgi:CRISPR-associated protein Cas2